MSDLVEDRVYDDRTGTQSVYVASESGVVIVEVAHRVGRFRLDHRCMARDVAVSDDLLAVATDEDVLVMDQRGEGSYVETGFGPADAVGFDDGALLAATSDEYEIGRLLHPREKPTEWLTVADVDASIRAIDGPLLAAADGVYRLTTDDIVHAGLDDARDVSSAGTPLVGTGSGLYRLANGWVDELDGPFDVVTARPDGETELAHAATADTFYENDGTEWNQRDVPDTPIVGVAYGETTYAVTDRATMLVDRGDHWESRSLGVPGVVGLAAL